MTDRIDHTARAKEILASEPVGLAPDGTWGTAIATEAQVHATLALVEQQRIANLIALASLPNDDRDRVDGEVAELIASALHGLIEVRPVPQTAFEAMGGPDEYPAIRPDIARALGIEVSDD